MRVPTQQEMDFAAADRRRQQRNAAELRAVAIDRELRRVIDQVGAKEVADRLGLDDETLVYHWLGRRQNRRPPVELLDVCLDLDRSEGLMEAICRDRYETPVRLSPLSMEQQNVLLRRALTEFGAAGEQKLKTIQLTRAEEMPR